MQKFNKKYISSQIKPTQKVPIVLIHLNVKTDVLQVFKNIYIKKTL